jgi:hypothetical protein
MNLNMRTKIPIFVCLQYSPLAVKVKHIFFSRRETWKFKNIIQYCPTKVQYFIHIIKQLYPLYILTNLKFRGIFVDHFFVAEMTTEKHFCSNLKVVVISKGRGKGKGSKGPLAHTAHKCRRIRLIQ